MGLFLSLISAGAQARSLPQATGLSSQPAGLTPTPGPSPGLGAPPSCTAAGRTSASAASTPPGVHGCQWFIKYFVSPSAKSCIWRDHKDYSWHTYCNCVTGNNYSVVCAANPNNMAEKYKVVMGTSGTLRAKPICKVWLPAEWKWIWLIQHQQLLLLGEVRVCTDCVCWISDWPL